MALAILLGVVDAALVFQFVIGIRDYRRRCDGSPRLVYWPRPFYHSPTRHHWHAR